ncbi:hypothetical protein LCGC14_1542620 [marine sediment metagenome]|uniref:Uncharacterized protein n=1 Tax=marine sediment metagenome TaxID=412755 RepID=A0A0F9ISN0_9ZZZZ
MKIRTIGLILFFFVLVVLFLNLSYILKTNWWTEVLCNFEDGKLEPRFTYNVCFIGDVEYWAKFQRSNEFYNLTSLGEKKEWKLVEVHNLNERGTGE